MAAADEVLDDRGDDVRDTVRQLSAALQTVSDGRDDLFATVRNLEAFTAAMEGSGEQITTFNEVMAAVTVSVSRGRGEIGPALTELDLAVDEVRDFVRDNRQVGIETVRTTTDLLTVLAEQRDDIVGDVENLSRGLRTHDTILAWEPAWMDPICEGFREAVRGSDLLVRLHADGLRARGVVYTDIVSTVDLLVHPPLEQSPPGTEVRVVRPFAGSRPVWHGEPGRDPDSRALVMEALGPT